MSRLPQNYKFPTSINAKIIWDLFYFGESSKRLSPFRFLEFKDFAGDNNDVTYFTKARCVVSVIGALAFKAGKFAIADYSIEVTSIPRKLIDSSLVGKAYNEMSDIFNCGYEMLLKKVVDKDNTGTDPGVGITQEELPLSSRRAAIQLSYSTLYKRLKMYDKAHPLDQLCSLVKI